MTSVSGIPASNILEHDISEMQKQLLNGIEKEFSARKLFIHDSYDTSISALKAFCLRQIQENSVQVIIIDNLQSITSWHHKKYREQEVNFISGELKNLAKENNICVIASSHLNRGVEYRTGLHYKYPQLADLRDSGAIEQDADKVLFVHRPEYYGFTEDEEGNSLIYQVQIIVAKNRYGYLGEIILLRD